MQHYSGPAIGGITPFLGPLGRGLRWELPAHTACCSYRDERVQCGGDGQRAAPEVDEAVNVLLLLIPVALFLGFLGLVAFFWSIKAGQFDDLDGAAHRMLLDDDLDEESKDERDSHS